MASTIKQVLDIARNQLGVGENPDGSNNNKFTNWYGVDTPWCAIFISWLFARADSPNLVLKAAWCPDQARWFQRRDQWGKKPKKGAIVYYDWGEPGSSGYNHVGIVEYVKTDGSFVTIEGNWHNGVRRVYRDMKYVSGFGYPEYAPSTGGGAGGGGGGGAKPRRKVSLSALRKAARSDPDRPQGGTTPGAADDVKIVESALDKEDLLSPKYAKDGSFGSLAVEAYAAWQRKCGFTGSDADGIPGRESLTRLGKKYGFSVVD